MASIIRIKRSSGILAPVNLKTAELAYAYGTGTFQNQGDRLFIGKGDNGSGQATSIVTIGGSYFTDMLDHNPGLLRTNSAIIVDSDKKIEELKSGNIHIDGFNDKITGLVSPTDSSGAATKKYVDSAIGLIPSAVFTFTGDSGSDTVTLTDSGLNFQGQPGEIHARVTDNNLLISLDSSGVVAGTYGSATSIPIIKVDDFGRVDSVGTSPLSTTLSIADSNDSHSIDLINDTLTFKSSDGTLEVNNDSSVMNFELPVVFVGSGAGGGNNGFTLPSVASVDSPDALSTHYGDNDTMPRMQFDKYGRLRTMSLYGNQPHIYWTDTDGSGSIYQTTANPHGGYKPVTFVGRDGVNVDLTGDQLAGGGGIRGDGAVKYSISLDSNASITSSTLSADSATFTKIKVDVGSNHGGMATQNRIELYGDIKLGNDINNHQLDLSDVRLTSNITPLSVNTSHMGQWGNPFASLTLGSGLNFAGTPGQDHIYMRSDRDSALTISTVQSSGIYPTATGDMVTYRTKNGDSAVVHHVDIVVDNDKNAVFGSGYTWNGNFVPGKTTMRHDTTDHWFEVLADSHTTAMEIAAKGITLIGYDPAYDFRSGMGAISGNGYINLDGNVVPAIGRGSSLYNQGYRRDLGASGTRFGTVYADHFNRPQVVDSGSYGGANAIPVVTVNQSGLIDSIGTVAVASQITVEDSDSTAVIDFASHNLKITSPGFPAFGLTYDPTLDIQLDSNEFTIAMPQVNSTGHVPGHTKTYTGSGTMTPRLAIDRTGRITDITLVSTQPVSHWRDTDKVGTLPYESRPSQSVSFLGRGGIKSAVTIGSKNSPSNTTFEFRLDSNISGLTSLQVGNVKLNGNTISSTDSSNQLFIDPFPVGDSGDLVVRGNLIVQGTQTTVNSTVVSLNDKNLVLADSATTSATADGAGLTVGGDQFDSTATKPQFVFDAATYRWDPNLPIDIPFVSLDSAVFLNGVALREVMEDHLDNFFGVDSNNAVTITYDDAANTMTWKGTDATTSQKGVSSFDSSNFTVTAGHVAVTVLDGGTY